MKYNCMSYHRKCSTKMAFLGLVVYDPGPVHLHLPSLPHCNPSSHSFKKCEDYSCTQLLVFIVPNVTQLLATRLWGCALIGQKYMTSESVTNFIDYPLTLTRSRNREYGQEILHADHMTPSIHMQKLALTSLTNGCCSSV
jgi:hypothetical protein